MMPTDSGDTVKTAQRPADQSELEGLVKAWLRRTIGPLEEKRHNSPRETSLISKQ